MDCSHSQTDWRLSANNCCLVCKLRYTANTFQSIRVGLCYYVQFNCNMSLCNRGLESTGWQLVLFWLHSYIKRVAGCLILFAIKPLFCSNYITICGRISVSNLHISVYTYVNVNVISCLMWISAYADCSSFLTVNYHIFANGLHCQLSCIQSQTASFLMHLIHFEDNNLVPHHHCTQL